MTYQEVTERAAELYRAMKSISKGRQESELALAAMELAVSAFKMGTVDGLRVAMGAYDRALIQIKTGNAI